jgi:hypothetical protein
LESSRGRRKLASSEKSVGEFQNSRHTLIEGCPVFYETSTSWERRRLTGIY